MRSNKKTPPENSHQGMKNDIRAFLVVGALGVGKTTVCKLLAEKYIIPSTSSPFSSTRKQFRHIDLDGWIARYKKMPVTEYFAKVGYEKFYEESHRVIKMLYKRHMVRIDNPNLILLIDVGSGSTFDYRAIELTKEFPSILLTSDPEYIFKREKCKTSHKTLGNYKYWQFSKEKDALYSQCKIKVDVSYLTVEMVAETVSRKIAIFNMQCGVE